MAAARRFFEKAMRENGEPEKIAVDKSGSNKAAIDAINSSRAAPIVVRQVKYLNNIVEQNHPAIKRVTRPMLGFKSFRSTGSVLAGIEFMHMIARVSSPTMVALACRPPANFMRWLGKSVQRKPGSYSAWRNSPYAKQRDRTG